MEALSTSRVTKRRFGRDVQANVGGVLFLLGGLVTLGGMLAPHPPEADTEGLILMALGLIGFGMVLLVLPHRLAQLAPPLSVAAAVVAASLGIFLNGERHGGPPMFNEFFYFWPALFVGYFFTPRRAALTLVGIGALYATVLSQMPATIQELTPRWTITMTSLVGTVVAMRVLRKRVDKLLSKLNELARTDVLTGLLNRRAFDERLADELDRARRTKEPFALVLGDIDHFKQINDRRGHAAGDEALARVAALLTEHSRTVDAVARIGGEEFALILPSTQLTTGAEAAERLRAALKAATKHDPISMSFGVVEGPLHGRLPDDLLRNADRALYSAKAKGRDRTVTPGDVTVTIAAPEPEPA